MRVAVVVRRFPVISQTFINQHVLGLLEMGCKGDIFCEDPDFDDCSSDEEVQAILDKVRVYRNGKHVNRRKAPIQFLVQYVITALCHPYIFVKSLQFSQFGGREGWYPSCFLLLSVFRKVLG